MGLIVCRRCKPGLIHYFKLQKSQTIPAGVSDDLLAELYDLVSNFGLVDGEGHMCVADRVGDSRLYVFIAVKVGDFSMTITRSLPLENPTLLKLDNGQIISLDPAVTAEDMEEFIKMIDEQMRGMGLIDETGQRKKLDFSGLKGKKLSVEILFQAVGMVVPLPHPTIEGMVRSMFDEPDKLVLIDGPSILDMKCLCHVRDVSYLRRKRKMTDEVLKELGFNRDNLSAFQALDDSRREEIKLEINRRLAD